MISMHPIIWNAIITGQDLVLLIWCGCCCAKVTHTKISRVRASPWNLDLRTSGCLWRTPQLKSWKFLHIWQRAHMRGLWFCQESVNPIKIDWMISIYFTVYIISLQAVPHCRSVMGGRYSCISFCSFPSFFIERIWSTVIWSHKAHPHEHIHNPPVSSQQFRSSLCQLWPANLCAVSLNSWTKRIKTICSMGECAMQCGS